VSMVIILQTDHDVHSHDVINISFLLMYRSRYWRRETVVERGLYRVLTMVYNTQNYWIFGLSPSSGVLETRKHSVSETESVSILR
jgi:S-adenosylmethionine hydrolase